MRETILSNSLMLSAAFIPATSERRFDREALSYDREALRDTKPFLLIQGYVYGHSYSGIFRSSAQTIKLNFIFSWPPHLIKRNITRALLKLKIH